MQFTGIGSLAVLAAAAAGLAFGAAQGRVIGGIGG